IKDSESRFVVVSNNSQLQKVLSKKRELKTVEKIVIFDPIKDITDRDPMVMSLDDLMKLGESYDDPGELDRRLTEIDPDDLASLIYTSGTTGDPKGVMLTHRNFLSNVESAMKVMPIRSDDVALSFLPLSHSLERMAGHFTMVYAGVTIAYAESLDKLPQNLREVKPTVLISVPRIYEKVDARIRENVEKSGPVKKAIFDWALGVGRRVSQLKQQKRPVPLPLKLQLALADKLVFSKLKEAVGGRIRYFVSGGAPLAKEIAEFFHAAGMLICEGYGLTETSPVLTANTPDAYKFGTVGKPFPGVEIKIADDGEILAKGPNVMKGYYKKPEATKEAFDEEGWFHTGDVGEFDEDGFLRITDRKKELIVTSGGKNIAPQPIENMLKMNKFIEQVCLIGDRRKFISAIVVPNFEALEAWAKQQGIEFSNREELVRNPKVVELYSRAIDEVNSKLAKYETIKKFVLSPIEFTQENKMLTPTLKVRRKVVMQKFANEIESMYAE
ncbi:MAG TPA: long-chain fatty acid--CoA ligase, partial [Proteobacteria bacterium]|nr:long-chain fatty acid--CoA ligase [Pseudomonadota bacterium]